ncbi:hypothetical protein BJF92_00455 [Rhizobium rhizosphaerae]|uniref:Biotin transporter BioY n=1 Tax=Xaviernesmea rhizosphaerae TaxID=1672749 RepID=A0A1Q9AEF9_9HYPH|nr:biotin transporter BioY [Xaviernesmea rhizosphaerae]OLP53276.1 hypothetical protein BJF92_00455 [Xaviernesmea rhizosphaerae]
MSGLETAIREALARSDRRSPEIRARIYQSARNALEAGLRKQNVTDAKVVEQQRHRLEVAIHAIEREERASAPQAPAGSKPAAPARTPPSAADLPFSASAPPAHPSAPRAAAPRQGMAPPSAPMPEDPLAGLRAERGLSAGRSSDGDAGRLDMMPDVDQRRREAEDDGLEIASAIPPVRAARPAPRRGAEPQEPSFDALDDDLALSDEDRAMAERLLAPEPAPVGPASRRIDKPGRRRRSRFFSFLLVLVTLVGTFGLAGWWAINGGLMKAAREGVIGQISVRGDDYDPSKGLRQLNSKSGFSADWKILFAPDQAAHGVTTGPRAVAAAVSDEGGQRLRITSSSPEDDGAVVVTIPVEIMRDLAGKSATIAVTVQADRGSSTQFSVECDFGALGNCGRHRFTINDERSDLLFKTVFSARAPTGPGRFLINSDVTGSGLSLNLYGVRVLADP